MGKQRSSSCLPRVIELTKAIEMPLWTAQSIGDNVPLGTARVSYLSITNAVIIAVYSTKRSGIKTLCGPA